MPSPESEVDVSRLRERIRLQLASAETIIVELRREIDRLRRDNLQLSAEREDIRPRHRLTA